MKILTHENNNTEEELSVGDELLVVLEEIPSSGYLWEVSTSPNGLSLILEDYLTEPDDQRYGKMLYKYWRFKAIGNLNNDLIFTCSRPWEKKTSDAVTLSFVLKN